MMMLMVMVTVTVRMMSMVMVMMMMMMLLLMMVTKNLIISRDPLLPIAIMSMSVLFGVADTVKA